MGMWKCGMFPNIKDETLNDMGKIDQCQTRKYTKCENCVKFIRRCIGINKPFTNIYIYYKPIDGSTGCWGRVTHICVSKLTIIDFFVPVRHKAIVWNNAGLVLFGPIKTNYNEIFIGIHIFSFKKSIWKCRLENGIHFVLASVCQHIEAEAKWTPIRRRHFQIHFLECKCVNFA